MYGDRILNEYIHQLKLAVKHYNVNLDIDELEQEVRFLYPIAWADFYRFLIGWNPQSWKICGFMEHMSKVGLSRVVKLTQALDCFLPKADITEPSTTNKPPQ